MKRGLWPSFRGVAKLALPGHYRVPNSALTMSFSLRILHMLIIFLGFPWISYDFLGHSAFRNMINHALWTS